MSRELQDILDSGEITGLDFDAGYSPVTDTEAATKAYVDQPRDDIQLDITAGVPAHSEGKIFYDPDHNAVSYFPDVDGVVINLGKEFVGDVYNNTGSTIPNGSTVTLGNGVDPITNRPYVKLASADTFDNARVLGVATHDIADLSTGIVTAMGVVHGLDTSMYTAGDLLYVSETPGAFTTTAPSITSVVGEVIRVHATLGAVFVKPRINIAIPTIFAQLHGLSASAYSLTTTPQRIVNYANKREYVMTGNTTAGTLSTAYEGLYRVSYFVDISFSSAVVTRTLYFRLYDLTAASVVTEASSSISIPRDETKVCRHTSLPFDVVAGHSYALEISASDIMSVSINSVSFDLQSVIL